jgi:hypothetical protein
MIGVQTVNVTDNRVWNIELLNKKTFNKIIYLPNAKEEINNRLFWLGFLNF